MRSMLAEVIHLGVVRLGTGKSASVELFRFLSPLGRKTRYA
jgi:hypothetical protein